MAVLDQAEDVFTAFRRRRDDQPHILDQLSDALANDDLPLRLLIVVRDEHVEALQRHEGLRAHIARGASYELEPLSAEAALEACRRPLESIGREFRPGVDEELVDDLRVSRKDPARLSASPATVEPVHLQLVCSALWESVRDLPAPIGSADLVDVDEVLGAYCHSVIEEVARDHFQGDTAGLLAQVRSIAGTGDAELPQHVAQALAKRHVLQLTGKRRYEMPDRLVVPFLRGATGRLASVAADHLTEAGAALHMGWFELAEKHAAQEIRNLAGTRSQARAQSLLGDAAYLRDEIDDALTHYRSAVRLFDVIPGTEQIVATLLTAIGRILIDQGAYRAAVTELNAAVRRSPEPVIQTELAWALWYVGHESRAVNVLNGALRRNGNTPEALRARGEILSDLERPERALLDLDRVQPHELASTQAAYALALALSGDVRGAVEAVPPLDVESDATTLLRAARVMKAAGRDSEASRLACRARQSTGRRPLPPQVTAAADRLIAP
jgi:tetratricopeptide (TPR) repeat protein